MMTMQMRLTTYRWWSNKLKGAESLKSQSHSTSTQKNVNSAEIVKREKNNTT